MGATALFASARQKSLAVRLLLAVIAVVMVFAAYRYWHRAPYYKGVSRLQVDLKQPELLLATRNLAELPKDVAAAPVLAGLVDEALVFHYEEDEARLSIEGALRRMAYEHKLSLGDRFLSLLLAGPAEVAIWRSGKGRPEYYVARLERGVLAKLTETLARIALDDRQLKQLGQFSLAGDTVTVYALEYGGGRTLAFAGRGEHWVFLSDPALAIDSEGLLTADAEAVLGELLRGADPWRAKLPWSATAQHSLVVGQRALTFGYGHFLPALAGLRLDYTGGAWQGSLRLHAAAGATVANPTNIWRRVPLGAALCAALPVDWQAVAAPLASLLGPEAPIAPLLAALDPIAAVCWYADSRLSAPLFVARAAQPVPTEASRLLARLAEKSWTGAAVDAGEGRDGGPLHAASIPSRHGLRFAAGGERRFEPALAQHADVIVFSPDRRQVEAALDVAAKRAAALGDEPGLHGAGWLVVDPASLARLVRAEVQDVLPADEESFFREVARQRLWPRLEAWGKQQPAVVVVPGAAGEDGFVALAIHSLQEPAR